MKQFPLTFLQRALALAALGAMAVAAIAYGDSPAVAAASDQLALADQPPVTAKERERIIKLAVATAPSSAVRGAACE